MVVGAGTMGVGIAYVALAAGYDVELVETDPERAQRAAARIDDLWRQAVARGRLTEPAQSGLARLRAHSAVLDVEPDADVLVEAVPERVDLKHAVLAAAEERAPRVLASNTSSISIAALAAPLRHPERLVGLHFFNPVWAIGLVEVVVGPATADATRVAALAVVDTLGKRAIVVRDAPGFATTRLGLALGLEAIRMVEDGVASVADIDAAMALGYRHPVGPLELGDLVGLDVRLDIARTLHAAYGDRFAPPRLLVSMVEAGRLGQKSGLGFYRWVDGRKSPADLPARPGPV